MIKDNSQYLKAGSLFYKVLKKLIKASSCVWVRRPDSSSSFFWERVSEKDSRSSAKNWDRVMPNAVHTFSSEGTDGTMFFLYHEEIVDWVRPERSAS